MSKIKSKAIVAAVGGGLLILGFLMCCSGIQFPFYSAKGALNGHLRNDLGVTLPASAEVPIAYWTAYRDPEHVFKVQMPPADVAPLFDSLRAAAKSKGYEAKSLEPEFELKSFGPAYRRPEWWNNPPLSDVALFRISITRDGMTISDYHFLYSPTTGILYVVWGEN